MGNKLKEAIETSSISALALLLASVVASLWLMVIVFEYTDASWGVGKIVGISTFCVLGYLSLKATIFRHFHLRRRISKLAAAIRISRKRARGRRQFNRWFKKYRAARRAAGSYYYN